MTIVATVLSSQILLHIPLISLKHFCILATNDRQSEAPVASYLFDHLSLLGVHGLQPISNAIFPLPFPAALHILNVSVNES